MDQGRGNEDFDSIPCMHIFYSLIFILKENIEGGKNMAEAEEGAQLINHLSIILIRLKCC